MARTSPLEAFTPATRAWFDAVFPEPTPAQAGAWRAISGGQNALVVAPTGSGKTLSAFLWALDGLLREPRPADVTRRCRVLYVSPLKALAVDVERNLRAPLVGIDAQARRLGSQPPEIAVAIRSGDTTAAQRRAFSTSSPDILITTPESLFLLLTSRARESLRGVRTVIVDEVHAVAGTKRGAHLALSLERLEELLDAPAQRIGLSATVRPVEEVARFLGGARPVTVVRPPSEKTLRVDVVVPIEDMTALDAPGGGETPPGAPAPRGGDDAGAEPRIGPEAGIGAGPDPAADLPFGGSAAGGAPRSSIWPAVENRVLDLVLAHRSTIVFANSRRLAEKLCARLNELYAERLAAVGTAAAAGNAAGAEAWNPTVAGGFPAQMMGGSGDVARPADSTVEIARAHHGSVSRAQREIIEEDLKAGRLPAVVATSSLELGIDMGAVDLVVQISSPPSIAAGLQRVGRAGHQVGAPSEGVILPKHRGELAQCAVVAERMAAGAIEELRIPRNPLDVLAQQIVAMVAMDSWDVDALAALARRSAPFAGLPASALEAVLDMLAGRYPSDEFAELRPRITWDRVAGTLTGRPGAQRLAVTSGGTIPDRGLFGVFLVGEGGGRVGELDEEMVYESRTGDVILLGSSSWRIEEITADRVLVTPAPGRPGRLPFWHGDSPARPAELGREIGAFVRALGRAGPDEAGERLRAAGLDDYAAGNLLAYLDEQRQATGHLPDDRTIVVERFRDELGDWRLAVHTPLGAGVHAPWALALGARLRERYGVEAQIMHADDGIVARVPDTDVPPEADLLLFDPDEIDAVVRAELGGSALFASRFRECAGRALLLPRRNPGRRTPLWQQRQRSAALLEVAAGYGEFPLVLETMRECLQDVFDTPALVGLMREVGSRRVRLVEVDTPEPSPFARTLLFGYVAAFMYEGDAPLAERRAQALSLDSSLLAELLGQAELRELIDPGALATVEAELQRLAPDRRARDAEGVADLLRLVGDLTTDEVVARGGTPEWLAELERAHRAIQVRLAGEARWAAAEDAGRLRDALGIPTPVGVPAAFTEAVRDPVGDLVSRYARTHGPFDVAALAGRLGIGVAVATQALERLAATGRVVRGELRPGASGQQWCDASVLRLLRRRSVAALRREVEPVPTAALARYLPAWQSVGADARARGVDGLVRVVEQLQGAPIPASAWETLVLPNRLTDYTPAMLDELCAAGEIVWTGSGRLTGGDGWVSFALADAAPLLLPEPDAEAVATPVHQAVLDALGDDAALFFRTLSDRVASTDDRELSEAVWDLVWSGHLTNDTIAPLRLARSGGGRSAHSGRAAPPRARGRRYGAGRPAMPRRAGPPAMAGRWSRTPERDTDPTRRAHAVADQLLDRYGIVTRGVVTAEGIPGGFAAVYRVLRAFEDAGRARRGYFVESLGAAQFALVGAVERVRAAARAVEREAEPPDPYGPAAGYGPGGVDGPGRAGGPGGAGGPRPTGPEAIVLAATDPANPYGAALGWPARPPLDGAQSGPGHRPGRKAGALVVLVGGELVLYVERGGRTLLSWSDEAERLRPAVDALSLAVREGWLGKLDVRTADGQAVLTSALGVALEGAGFHPTPSGLRLRG